MTGSNFWVIGGEFGSMNFHKLVEGTTEVKGPFKTRKDAEDAWRAVSEENRHSDSVRFSIVDEMDEGSKSILGMLTDIRSTIRLVIGPKAQEEWLETVLQKTLEEFVSNHKTLVKYFPLDAMLEEIKNRSLATKNKASDTKLNKAFEGSERAQQNMPDTSTGAPPYPEAAPNDEIEDRRSEGNLSEDDWREVEKLVAQYIEAHLLDTPEAHLAYVRDRIKSVVKNVGP